MKELKGTKTEKNLQEAFAGESMARNKYTYFASKAKKDGYVQIAAIFEETAKNEQEHAKLWYKYLNGNKINGTEANLADAAAGENFAPTTGTAARRTSCWILLPVRTSNGQICMPVWQKKLVRKDLTRLLLNSKA